MAVQSKSKKEAIPIRLVLITMDTHLNSAARRAQYQLQRVIPGLSLQIHAASEFTGNPELTQKAITDIAHGDIVLATMLFMEDHYLPVFEALKAKRDDCDAMVCAMSAGEVVKLTKIGKLDMSKPASGPMAILKKLRPKPKSESEQHTSSGAKQMKVLRLIPQILRWIPGTAQDVRVYFLTLQYWLGGSEENLFNLFSYLINRYAAGPREVLRGLAKPTDPVEYPDLGVYHPRMKNRLSEKLSDLPKVIPDSKRRGRVGLLLLRSYLVSGNSGHYDPVIAALEAHGLQVVPAFASGLDSRPAIDTYFMKNNQVAVDAVISLTGFS